VSALFPARPLDLRDGLVDYIERLSEIAELRQPARMDLYPEA
jgi:hypothetical protein